MQLSKSQKRWLIILSVFIGIILIVILTINLITASLIEGKVKAALEKNNSEYKVSIRKVGGNIFFGNIRVKDIIIKPDTSLLNKLKEGTAPTSSAFDIEIPLIRLVGVGMYDAIVHANISIKSIEIKRAKIKIYKGKPNDSIVLPPKKDPSSLKFDPDSIYLKNLNGISIGSVVLEDNEFMLYDIEEEKQITSNTLSELEITDFYITKYPDIKHVFFLDVFDLKLNIKGEKFELPGNDYYVSLDRITYAIADSTLRIKGLKFKPQWKDKFKMAAQWKYTQEIFDVEVGDITVHSLHQKKLVRDGKIYIDSIIVGNLNLDILKDKRYPFDTAKRPTLPYQSLKTMKLPLYIGKVNIRNSNLVYKEKEEGSKELMTVNLGDLSADISFITSVRDSILTKKPMKVALAAKMMNIPTLRVYFSFPLHTRSDDFYFSGSLGSVKLSMFNSATFPALGMKILNGQLNSLTFKGSANATVSNGEMTMLYENLEGEVSKKDHERKNKFMSWAANSVLKKGNPGKNGKTRVAVLHFERVMYKGFGNFIWKTLQTGIVHTIVPAGKQVKQDKPQNTKESKKEDPSNVSQEADSEDKASKKESRKEKRKNKKDKKDK